MAAGDHPRCVVTSLAAPTPPCVYEDISGARGNGENHSKAVQGDRHRDRPSATTCLANARRLLLSGAASVLPHALRNPDTPTDCAGPGPTLDRAPHPLHSGAPDETVQGPSSPPPPECLPRQSAAAPCDGLALSRPTPRGQHVVIGSASPASTGSDPSQRRQDSPQRGRDIPEGQSCVHCSLASLLTPQRP
jgi:hypothetical protein